MPAHHVKGQAASATSRPARQQKATARAAKNNRPLYEIEPHKTLLRAMAQFEWAYDKAEEAGFPTLDMSIGLSPIDVVRSEFGLPENFEFELTPGLGAHSPEDERAARERLTRELLNRHGDGTIPPILYRFLLTRLIEGCRGVPKDLKRLTRLVLGVDRSLAGEIGKPGAYSMAVVYATHYPHASLREIAAFAGVAPATVARLFKKHRFR
jgi:hypothetical protein